MIRSIAILLLTISFGLSSVSYARSDADKEARKAEREAKRAQRAAEREARRAERAAQKEAKKAEKLAKKEQQCIQKQQSKEYYYWDGSRCKVDRDKKNAARAAEKKVKCEQKIASGKLYMWDDGKGRCVRDKEAVKAERVAKKKAKCDEKIAAGKTYMWDDGKGRCVRDKEAAKLEKLANKQNKCDEKIKAGKNYKWDADKGRCVRDKEAAKLEKLAKKQNKCDEKIKAGKPYKWENERCVKDKDEAKKQKLADKKKKCDEKVKAGKPYLWNADSGKCEKDKKAKLAQKNKKFCDKIKGLAKRVGNTNVEIYGLDSTDMEMIVTFQTDDEKCSRADYKELKRLVSSVEKLDKKLARNKKKCDKKKSQGYLWEDNDCKLKTTLTNDQVADKVGNNNNSNDQAADKVGNNNNSNDNTSKDQVETFDEVKFARLSKTEQRKYCSDLNRKYVYPRNGKNAECKEKAFSGSGASGGGLLNDIGKGIVDIGVGAGKIAANHAVEKNMNDRNPASINEPQKKSVTDTCSLSNNSRTSVLNNPECSPNTMLSNNMYDDYIEVWCTNLPASKMHSDCDKNKFELDKSSYISDNCSNRFAAAKNPNCSAEKILQANEIDTFVDLYCDSTYGRHSKCAQYDPDGEPDRSVSGDEDDGPVSGLSDW